MHLKPRIADTKKVGTTVGFVQKVRRTILVELKKFQLDLAAQQKTNSQERGTHKVASRTTCAHEHPLGGWRGYLCIGHGRIARGLSGVSTFADLERSHQNPTWRQSAASLAAL